MLYTIVTKEKGTENGFKPENHTCLGDMMVLNENELRKIDDDIEAAAHYIGGTIMTNSEVKQFIKEGGKTWRQ